MAKITCAISEYHKFLGPRIRNAIQSMTKKKKRELNFICQECGQKDELEACHIKGSDRKKIIEEVISEYVDKSSGSLEKVDLEEIEKKIMERHLPIDKYFKFLCPSCHRKYDKSDAHADIVIVRADGKIFKQKGISPTITTKPNFYVIERK